MARPGRSQAYADQSDTEVGDPVAFVLDDSFWTESPTAFQVNKLPPSFTLDAAGLNLGGETGCQMDYTLFVRGVNSEGPGDWFPLRWTVATTAATEVTLYGLPVEWPATPQIASGTAASVLIVTPGLGTFGGAQGKQGAGAVGQVYVNDIAIDGTSQKYGSEMQNRQLIVSAGGASFFRATDPGWEILVDLN